MKVKKRGSKIGKFRKVPGPIGKQCLERAEQALSKTTADSYVVIAGGQGTKIFDADGNEYLCFDSGVCVANLGYGKNQRPVWQAIEKIKKAGAPLYIGTDRINPQSVQAAELMKKITPIREGHDARVYFDTKGTLAVETAIKALSKAKSRQGIPPKKMIFCYCTGSFHGRTLSALTIMDKRNPHRITGYSLPYRYIELRFPTKNRRRGFISRLEKLSKSNKLNRIAGFFIEVVQGEGGINPADKTAIQALDQWCQKHNIPLVFDEIQSGFGRTGTFWAYEQYGIKPDMVVFGKGAGGGVVPIAGVVMRDDLSFRQMGEHSGTFGPDPILTAALTKTVQVTLEKQLAKRARKMGQYFISRLREVFGSKIWLKEIRGQGLMIGMEFWNPENKKPFPEFRDALWYKAEELGLLAFPAGFDGANPILRFEPPLTVTKKEIRKAIQILYQAANLI